MVGRFHALAGAAALVVLGSTPAAGQWVPARSDATCGAGSTAHGHIGITALDCATGCDFGAGVGAATASFRAEPRIATLDPYSARSTGLREGDVIVAVDGHLITTQEGARRFSTLAAGQPVELRVRRSGQEQTLSVTPLLVCRPASAAVAAAAGGSPTQAAGRTPLTRATAAGAVAGGATPVRAGERVPYTAAQRVGGAPTAAAALFDGVGTLLPTPAALPTGALGFAIECSDCGAVAAGSAQIASRWLFSSPPRVYRVEMGGPAARAGLRSEDRIVSVNGLPLTTAEGARAFGAIRPGDAVVLEYRRGGATQRARLVAESPALAAGRVVLGGPTGAAAAAAAVRVGAPRLLPLAAGTSPPVGLPVPPLRFVGQFGDAAIEVHSPHRVAVTEVEGGQELEIVIGDSVIRIRRAPAAVRPVPDR